MSDLTTGQASMTSSRPYLIRAMYEWIIDNGMTPHLLVFADDEQVIVPREHVDDGKIVLNISPTAVKNLDLGNEVISFSGRFSGQKMDIYVPVSCAVAIYTRENGKGMVFSPDEEPTPPPSGKKDDQAGEDKQSKSGHLRVVK